MNKVIAVIGSGYGDEGKGQMVNYFSSLYDDAIVVRSNGGCQAGHTAVALDGKRHVFSHFGSGTFNGSPTFLSKYFVLNPLLFEKEHRHFVKKFGITPKIFADPRCIVTTPYDMMLNQRFETERGTKNHGSCGVGFGETIERSLVYLDLTLDDLLEAKEFSKESLMETVLTELKEIRQNYIPMKTDLSKLSMAFKELIYSKKLKVDFVKAVQYMLKHITAVEPDYLKNNTLIFEGAQGLLLDMDYGYFPHVTRSNCGMKNISQILNEAYGGNIISGDVDIVVNYVTRSYTTRHGAGPLNHETDDIMKTYNIVDDTNVPNKFQGELRFAPLDFELFKSITDKDFLNYAPRGSKKTVTITCMDQLGEEASLVTKNNEVLKLDRRTFTNWARNEADYLSYGTTYTDVKQLDKTE